MSAQLATALLDALDEEALEALAERLAPLLASRLAPSKAPSQWMNAAQAAEHLACSRDRVYDLVQLHKLTPRRDGRRLLFRRADLDALVEQAA